MTAIAVIIALGVLLMGFGVVMVGGWLGGQSDWFGAEVFDRLASSKSDRWLLYITFVALVLAPLFGGALMIIFGLHYLR